MTYMRFSDCGCDALHIGKNMLTVAQAQDCAKALISCSSGNEPVQLLQALGRICANPRFGKGIGRLQPDCTGRFGSLAAVLTQEVYQDEE